MMRATFTAASLLAACSSASGDTSFGGATTSTADTTSADTSSSSTGATTATRVRVTTELGDLVFEIHETEAPITSANFLRYVDESRFDDATFYRTVTLDNQPDDDVKIEVVQGGLGGASPDALPPIAHETTMQTGITHQDGTLSMARADVGTASSEFFVCIGAQPELDFGGARNPDGQGFAAFGSMLDGSAVARAIQQSNAVGQDLQPPIAILSVARE